MALTETHSMLATRSITPRHTVMMPPDDAGDTCRVTVIGRDTERPR
jgi:hypothetical protein